MVWEPIAEGWGEGRGVLLSRLATTPDLSQVFVMEWCRSPPRGQFYLTLVLVWERGRVIIHDKNAELLGNG
jgi:hypothetical protein